MAWRWHGSRPDGVALLAAEKTVGAVFFLAATVVLIVLGVRGVTHPIQNLFAGELAEDPHDFLARLLLRAVPQVNPRALLTLGLAASGYFALHVVEATGLWLRRLWVEYLVLIETAGLLPYEVYELTRQATRFKILLLLLNAIIVGYLVYRRVERRGRSPRS